MNIYFPNEEKLDGITHMCIAAHQDDIEIMAFGPISECYESEDKAFAGVVVTDGAGSPRTGEFADFTDEQMKEVRVAEQQRAADIGKYRAAIQLGFPSKAVKNPECDEPEKAIYDLLMKIRPAYLYTHNIADKHETHVAVALRTIAAVKRMPEEARPKVFVSLEVWRSLDWLPDKDKVCVDTAKYPEVARELLTVHRSQVEGGKRYDNAAIGRRFANATFFASHDTDECISMNFGLDLMPLVKGSQTPAEFINGYIDNFKAEVNSVVERLYKND
ncbi:MAG: PIG-L family deacetylase [Clostridia bacterium]|nr:PIG-L family deacetylase [Clostridia bacterium]